MNFKLNKTLVATFAVLLCGMELAEARGYVPDAPKPEGFHVVVVSTVAYGYWSNDLTGFGLTLTMDDSAKVYAENLQGVIALKTPINVNQSHHFTLVASNLAGPSEAAVFDSVPTTPPPANLNYQFVNEASTGVPVQATILVKETPSGDYSFSQLVYSETPFSSGISLGDKGIYNVTAVGRYEGHSAYDYTTCFLGDVTAQNNQYNVVITFHDNGQLSCDIKN